MTEEQDKAAMQDEDIQPDEQQEDVELSGELGPSLEEQLEAAKQAVVDAQEQSLRAVAEAQNIRRRAEKDAENARKFALEKFAGDMLPVVDNLDRALASADVEDEALKPILEGVELTRKTLVDALARHNVEQLNPVGEPFDPEYHEAMAMVPNPDVEPNSVMDVMQKGYTLNGRLLRAAMVVIAKAP
ncbi:Protein GrpE [Zhongshania aliphaticivorans]|uniref:Protein GrpE n=1 Tax=Zhongshania aliphaticivorans TaxID=1470434 RepID=A0A5S9N618_9GAMM|nr:nucleotide exchange factor GrpE [Zhongshania aliphaticivorans]CAA0081507.1 Protein GrpE [Zhongshania aliphaticivorans]CAA0084966.1 Protein GrpE [Zhongshania aliphaticivorans]